MSSPTRITVTSHQVEISMDTGYHLQEQFSVLLAHDTPIEFSPLSSLNGILRFHFPGPLFVNIAITSTWWSE